MISSQAARKQQTGELEEMGRQGDVRTTAQSCAQQLNQGV